MIPELPIDALRPELEAAWSAHRNFILRAPTGSGKSTRVPRFLYHWHGFDPDRLILVLQPRRMAARLLARRVAAELGEEPGQTAGYQIRFEARRSSRTRLLYVTEGLLWRWLGDGGDLKGVGAILFDEFHERHLEGDVGLGMALIRQSEGWDGRIGVFSATLEVEKLSGRIPDAEVLESEGRQYPVETRYCGGGLREPPWERAVRGFKEALREGAEGDILVFMPGKYEIVRTVSEIGSLREARGWEIYPLHGDLDAASQDRAIATGERPRVVVSTNIAETSLTLPGIRTVIDSGLARIPDYDPRRGVNTLLTEPISRAGAEQRAGRAGRVAPGRCYRLWAESEHIHREAYTVPEIRRLDLAETCLQLAVLGRREDFPWLEEPPAESWQRAILLLEELGAIRGEAVTETGREMARFPLHPRYSRILIEAKKRECVGLVAMAIALSEGRQLIMPLKDKHLEREREEWWAPAEGLSDHLKEVLVWQKVTEAKGAMEFCRRWGIHAQTWRQSNLVYQQILRIAGLQEFPGEGRIENFAKCLLTGYVDQVALRRDRGTLKCDLVHGRRGELRRESLVRDQPLFVATEVEEREFRGEAVLFLGMATALKEEWLAEIYPDELATETLDRMDMDRRRVERVERVVFHDLVLREKAVEGAELAGAGLVLARAIHENQWVLKNWNYEAETWIRRLNVLARHCPELELKPIEEEDRLILVEQICEGARSYKEVKDRPVMPVLESWVPDALLPLIEEWVPLRFALPGTGRPKLRYEEDGTVVLPARIQQLYDVPGDSLRICQDRCRLRLEILAPNGRPVQITDDLDGFWSRQYPQIRKELFGRYPKHEWR